MINDKSHHNGRIEQGNAHTHTNIIPCGLFPMDIVTVKYNLINKCLWKCNGKE